MPKQSVHTSCRAASPVLSNTLSWQHNQHLNRLLVQQTLQMHEGFRRKGHVMFLEKLLKLLLEWLRFHITTFSHLHIFFLLNFFFNPKPAHWPVTLVLWPSSKSYFVIFGQITGIWTSLCVSVNIFCSFSLTLCPKSLRLCTCAAYIWSVGSSASWTPALTPEGTPSFSPLPRQRELFSVCCFSPCLPDVHSQIQWLLGGVRLDRTTQSPTLCWYSCLPRGLTTAPEERLQRNGSGPWCWPSSPFTSPLDWRGPGSHSWALSPVPDPPVPSYWPLFSSRTLIICPLGGSPLWNESWNVRRHVTGVSHEEDHQRMCRRLAHANHRDFLLQQESIQVHLSRFHRALSPVKHNTADRDHPSAEEALSISHTWRKVWVTASFQ